MSGQRIITCICCGTSGRHRARNLVVACYKRYERARTLDRFSRIRQPAAAWKPTGKHGSTMLERYQRLAAVRPPLKVATMAFEMGVSERQVWRYAAAARAAAGLVQDTAAPAAPASDVGECHD
ncbi:hypothetical protein [Nonomuraea typhae]|uniref:hypothetical protein n=1 Tax=Nonomuraea typhae TaxID=2603600 RepID=UPI0012FC5015|nr:hypothetical protein [Nonomuraea typhae]